METERQKARRAFNVTPPGVETPPLYPPCPRCHGLGALEGGGFCDCAHGAAARGASRPDPTRRGLTPVREIAAGGGKV